MTAVLFTCAGQRVDIVTAFARAGATTIAADASGLAPALYRADVRAVVPPISDPGYLDALQELVVRHDVRLIVPLADLDHVVLAEGRDRIGALVLLAGFEAIRICEDKYLAHVFFEEKGIPSPAAWLPGELPDELPFPVLVKARRGFGSATSTARTIAPSSTSSWRTRRPTRWCSSSAPARSSRSTSSATSTAAA